MQITTEGFREWLFGQPAKSIVGIALPYSDHPCPIEKYLEKLTGTHCLVYGSWYVITGISYILPSDLANFTYIVDARGRHEVTREEALMTLEESIRVSQI